MDTIFKIPDNTESVSVTVSASGKEYVLPAIRFPGNTEVYRIPHKVLWHLFKLLTAEKKGLFMQTNIVGTPTPAYAVASCRITDGDKAGDSFYGETKISFSSSKADKEAPLAAAINRAQDKAILDYLGLESQYFTKDGEPSLYAFDTEFVSESGGEDSSEGAANSSDTETSVSDEDVASPDDKFTVEAAPKVYITDEEKAELDALSSKTLTLSYKSGPVDTTISTMSEKVLSYLSSDKFPNEEYRGIIRRYLELREKNAKNSFALMEEAAAKANGGT